MVQDTFREKIREKIDYWTGPTDENLLYIFHYEKWALGLDEDRVNVRLLVPKNPNNKKEFEIIPTSFVRFIGYAENDNKEEIPIFFVFLHPRHNKNLLQARAIIRHELAHIYFKDGFGRRIINRLPKILRRCLDKLYYHIISEVRAEIYQGNFFNLAVFILFLPCLIMILAVSKLEIIAFLFLICFYIWLHKVLPWRT